MRAGIHIVLLVVVACIFVSHCYMVDSDGS